MSARIEAQRIYKGHVMQLMHPESQTRQRQILRRSVVLLRWSVGALFVFSGATKLLDINSFTQAVRDFAVVNSALVPFITYSIPVLEIILGGALVLNVRVVAATNSLLALLALFSALMYEKLLEGMKISCGCFGGPDTSVCWNQNGDCYWDGYTWNCMK